MLTISYASSMALIETRVSFCPLWGGLSGMPWVVYTLYAAVGSGVLV